MDAITNPDTTNTIDKNPEQPRRWRDVLPVHPAAELFPLMSKDELRELGEDIKKNGLTAPIIFWVRERKDWDGMARVQLLDGRNRLDAMEHIGLKLLKGGKFNLDALKLSLDLVVGVPSGSYKHVPDPYAYVLSANIHRRHLTAEQKRDLIAKLLKAKPETSNLQIAKQVKADDKTVAKVRAKLETDSEIPSRENAREHSGTKTSS